MIFGADRAALLNEIVLVYYKQDRAHVSPYMDYMLGEEVRIVDTTCPDSPLVICSKGHTWAISLDSLKTKKQVNAEEEMQAQSIWNPDYGKYLVLDAETTVRAPPVYKFKAHPACPLNRVVAWGAKTSDDTEVHITHSSDITGLRSVRLTSTTSHIIVGHRSSLIYSTPLKLLQVLYHTMLCGTPALRTT